MDTAVLLITPAFREWPNLEILAPQVLTALGPWSTKSRWVVACEADPPAPERARLGSCSTQIEVIPRSEGHASFADALQVGLDQIADDDIVVFMDGDLSHDPTSIPRLVGALLQDDALDVVIASRYTEGGSTDNPPILRLMSRTVNLAFRVVLGIRARDLSTNFKAYRAELLRDVHLISKNFEAVEELLLVAQIRKGSSLHILELPDHFRNRLHGESKRKLGQFIGSYLYSLVRLKGRLKSDAAVLGRRKIT